MQVHNLTAASAAAFRTGNPGKLFGANIYNGATIRIAIREGSATGRVLMVIYLSAEGVDTEMIGESGDGAQFGNSGLWCTAEAGSPTNMLLQVYTD